jgi:catabolite regulation protein CreA
LEVAAGLEVNDETRHRVPGSDTRVYIAISKRVPGGSSINALPAVPVMA